MRFAREVSISELSLLSLPIRDVFQRHRLRLWSTAQVARALGFMCFAGAPQTLLGAARPEEDGPLMCSMLTPLR